VKDSLSIPIVARNWTSHEELLLLEVGRNPPLMGFDADLWQGLETFGIGNWPDIKEYVATKTKEECCSHYNQV